jgi:hypothetical protein
MPHLNFSALLYGDEYHLFIHNVNGVESPTALSIGGSIDRPSQKRKGIPFRIPFLFKTHITINSSGPQSSPICV